MKAELQEAGEDTSDMITSVPKLRKEILNLADVDIMDGEKFKEPYRILDELSAKWKDLSDTTRATLTEDIAGKNRANIFNSLMSSYDTARNALQTSINSEGSAMEEHEKWMDSIEARTNVLKASFQTLSQDFLNSDFVKGAISFLTDLTNAFDSLINTIGAIPTTGLVAGLGAIILNFGSSKEFAHYGCESIVA
jgi:TP901 family phage tail tape measure protein